MVNKVTQGPFGSVINVTGPDINTNVFPGVAGTNYFYPSEAFSQFIDSMGYDTVKLLIRWERIQNTLGGALATSEISLLKKTVRYFKKLGINTIISLNNKAGYNGNQLGSGSGPSQANLVDVWNKIAKTFKNEPGIVGYNVMNSPTGVTGGITAWQSAEQAAVDEILSIDANKYVIVDGYGTTPLSGWFVTQQNNPWIIDPTGKVVYSVDAYFDGDFSGTYTQPYEASVTVASGQGFNNTQGDALKTRTVNQIKAWLDWAANNNVLGLIGETGIDSNSSNYLALYRLFLETVANHPARVSVAPFCVSEVDITNKKVLQGGKRLVPGGGFDTTASGDASTTYLVGS